MKPYARREDGALLMVDDLSEANPAAQIVSPDGTWTTTLQAALARGEWVLVEEPQEAQTVASSDDLHRADLAGIAARVRPRLSRNQAE